MSVMNLEPTGAKLEPANADPGYWSVLIDEVAAASFLGLSRRYLQNVRQRGGGPRYVRLSSRCIRYRRSDLQEWVEARLRTSTADPGPEAAAA